MQSDLGIRTVDLVSDNCPGDFMPPEAEQQKCHEGPEGGIGGTGSFFWPRSSTLDSLPLTERVMFCRLAGSGVCPS